MAQHFHEAHHDSLQHPPQPVVYFPWHRRCAGTIPSELGKLTALRKLHLQGNKLTGEVKMVCRGIRGHYRFYSACVSWDKLRGRG